MAPESHILLSLSQSLFFFSFFLPKRKLSQRQQSKAKKKVAKKVFLFPQNRRNVCTRREKLSCCVFFFHPHSKGERESRAAKRVQLINQNHCAVVFALSLSLFLVATEKKRGRKRDQTANFCPQLSHTRRRQKGGGGGRRRCG